MGGVGVNEEAVAYASAAVVAAPNYGAVFAEDRLEGFDQDGADGALVWFRWKAA